MISEDMEYRHQLILKLHGTGYSDKEISKYLNENNILSPRGHEYYPSLIWSTRKKLRDREIRKEDYTLNVNKLCFYIQKR
jgi:predicted esterase